MERSKTAIFEYGAISRFRSSSMPSKIRRSPQSEMKSKTIIAAAIAAAAVIIAAIIGVIAQCSSKGDSTRLDASPHATANVTVNVTPPAAVTKEDLAAAVQHIDALFVRSKPAESLQQSRFPPELTENPNQNLNRTVKENEVLALINLKHYAEADQVIQQLKQHALQNQFRILSLEGDNWFKSGQYGHMKRHLSLIQMIPRPGLTPPMLTSERA
jgi:hypothetical protein